MKKIYLLTLFLCLCLGFALVGCNEDTDNNLIFKYTELADGTYEISVDQLPDIVDPNIVIPDKHNGKAVSRIAQNAFEICGFSIDSITIPDTVKSIGSFAFADCTIDKITLSKSITKIEECAFNNANINEIYYAGSISDWCGIDFEVGTESAVEDTEYHNIYSATPMSCVSNGIRFSDGRKGWNEITEITVPASIKKIGDLQFFGFGNLTAVTLHNEITEIGFAAFGTCVSLTTCDLGSGIDTVSDYAFYGCDNLSNIELTDKITHIGEFAFANCSGLSFTELPVGLTEIDCHSFDGCAIESITIPGAVTTIKDGAFANCSYLTEITFGSNVKSLEKNAFLECTSLERVNYLGTIDEWASIAFGGGIIYGVDLPETANPIYYSKKLYINDSLVTSAAISGTAKVSEYAFINCSSLTNVSLADTITNIGDYAFYGCDNLKNVNMTNNIETLGKHAFHSCPALTYNAKDGVNYLGNETNGTLVAISPVSRSTVQDIVLADECRIIYIEAFENCTALKNVTFNNSLIEIGAKAFSGCTSLLNFSLPTSVKTIEYYAFRDCTKLTLIDLPANTSYIGHGAFQGCSALTSVSIPEAVNAIEDWTFYGCTNLQQVNIPAGVKKIETLAFCYCDSLQEIDISESNEYYTFADGCLYNKSKTELIMFIDTAKTTLTIADGVKKISNCAFIDFHSLTSVYIPKSVVEMDENVFCGSGTLTIYCEHAERPSGWNESWDISNCTIIWGYNG